MPTIKTNLFLIQSASWRIIYYVEFVIWDFNSSLLLHTYSLILSTSSLLPLLKAHMPTDSWELLRGLQTAQ